MGACEDKGGLDPGEDVGQGGASPCIVQADAQILELAEGIISIRKIIFLFFFHIFIKDENYNYTW